ncbi:MAG: phosphomannomutase/phosphoglucomutase [Epsilonproteobacteria bacterium]|nr:phosphomannomutase/phosphoglucomutase [Campylobacterota bacterium]NPA89587.1 phosphomannomutase/phosphoglucomutase [Campylobacterota bacterium]
MEHIFREYDIRGIFGEELTEPVVKAIGYYLGKEMGKGAVFVSYDARLHSPTLFNWLISGLNWAGVEVIGGGLLPTGANYFANFQPVKLENGEEREVVGSIQITGSHNPPQYNGFKITKGKKPFFGAQIGELGKKVLNFKGKIPDNFSYLPSRLREQYINYLLSHFNNLKGMELNGVLDCGNGAVGVVLEKLLEKLQIKNYHLLYCEPDGNFPHHHPDPTELENLQDMIGLLREGKYRYGFGFDGDGDRIVFLEGEKVYGGDELLYFFSTQLESPHIITEVKASQGVIDAINRRGKVEIWKTGHSNLKNRLAQTGADIAGEVSGHLFFNDRYFGVDDAIYGALRIMELIQKGVNFSSLQKELGEWLNTPEIKVPVPEERKFQIVEKLKDELRSRQEELGITRLVEVDGVRVHFPDGWGLVRASNTTPYLTTRFEGKDAIALERIQTTLQKIVEELIK